MIKKLWQNFFSTRKQSTIQTFTFYIPAPPKRRTGYREKEFDQIFYEFINAGYDIIDIKTQSHSTTQSSGMWFICVVKSTKKITKQPKFEDFRNEDESDEYLYDEDLNPL